MKDKNIEIKRQVWESLRQYRFEPIKRRYLENLHLREVIKPKNYTN